MAVQVNKDLVIELTDLVAKRRELCKLGFRDKVRKIILPGK